MTTSLPPASAPVAARVTTAAPAPPEHFLVRHIRAHIDKGDKAKDKAEQHYIAAGQHLATLKAAYTKTWEEWEDLLKFQVMISTGRASELMQLADGRKTVAQIRADTNRRQIKHRLRYNEEEFPDAHAAGRAGATAVNVPADAEQARDDLETLGEPLGEPLVPNTDSTRSRPSRPVVAGSPITARGLVRILADATPEVRAEAVEALISGTCQTDFVAVREAVSDLYQQLSKAGR